MSKLVPLEIRLYSLYLPAYVAIASARTDTSAVERWRHVKVAIRAAVDAARRRIAEVADAGASTTESVMRSISRVVMHSDAWLANRLIERTVVARSEVCVEGGRVSARAEVGAELIGECVYFRRRAQSAVCS